MCLETVSKRKPKETGFGWKVFNERSDGGLYGNCYIVDKVRPLDKWLNEGDYREHNPTGLDYPPGWHIFKKRRDAEEWPYSYGSKIHKVEYRKAHTKGTEATWPRRGLLTGCVVVAKEIKILKEK